MDDFANTDPATLDLASFGRWAAQKRAAYESNRRQINEAVVTFYNEKVGGSEYGKGTKG